MSKSKHYQKRLHAYIPTKEEKKKSNEEELRKKVTKLYDKL